MSALRAVSIDVLGPLRATVDGAERALNSRRQRALLAALVVRDRRPVSVGDLVDALWDDDPPDRARTTLQTYVSRLRGLIGPGTILQSPAGYRLADDVVTDLATARAAVAEIELLDRGDPRRGEIAERVIESWRGPALSEFDGSHWFRGHAVELAEMRANLIDVAAAGMIVGARCPQAVSLLQRSLASDPLREPAQILLVKALHGAGRATEAVRAAASYREALRDETGLLPGPQFAAVEQLVLSGAPAAAITSTNDPPEDEPHEDRPTTGGTAARRPAPDTHRWSSATLARPTALIGRTSELARIESCLGSSRLVTVVGTGGVGKTRLVAEYVELVSSTERVLVVELSTVTPDAVLVTLGAHLGVREEQMELRTLAELLRQHRVLLVLDNAEHVIAEVRELTTAVLRSCPHVRILVTSRERLDVADEVVVGIGPLPVEEPGADAVTLFVDRMRRARPHEDVDRDRPSIVELCNRVDGVPLAVELTASRAASLGVAAVVDRFDALFGDLLDVSAGGQRHATLGNVVTWSIDLLGDSARALLSALAVFSGDFTVDAAAAVAAGAAIDADSVPLLLGRLVDTSLVTETDGRGRFRLLEMIRAVAHERLARSGHHAEVLRAHARWVARCAVRIDGDSVGPIEAGTVAALDALRPELSPALRWAIGSGDVATAAAITRALGGPLLYRPNADLIRQIRGLGEQRSIVGAPDEAAVVAADARAAFLVGDLEAVDRLAGRAIELAGDDRAARHRAEHALGVVLLYQGRFRESEQYFLPASESPTADTAQHLDALGGLALARCYEGDAGGALAVAQQLAAAADAIDSDTYRAFADYARGEIELANGDVDAAVARLAAAADRAWQVGARFVWGVASTVLARVLVRHRPADEARRELPLLIERWSHTATWPQLWTTLRLTAEHLAATGQPSVALLVVESAALDPAAPILSEDDLARSQLIHDEVSRQLGAATVTGIRRGAGAVERTTVVERALDALRRPIAG